MAHEYGPSERNCVSGHGMVYGPIPQTPFDNEPKTPGEVMALVNVQTNQLEQVHALLSLLFAQFEPVLGGDAKPSEREERQEQVRRPPASGLGHRLAENNESIKAALDAMRTLLDRCQL